MPPAIKISRALAAAALGVVLVNAHGCDDKAGEDCTPGTQGCACAEENGCVGELICLSEVCVDPDQPGTPDGSGGADTDGAPETDGGGIDPATGGDSAGGPADTSVCNRLLECLSRAAPAQVPEAVAAYGPNGSCWDDADLREVCLSACAASLTELSNYDAEACRQCETAKDCTYFEQGKYCLAGSCVECLDDSSCPDEKPRCVPTASGLRCVEENLCPSGGFLCPSIEECVPQSWVCDGYDDCPLGEDELGC